VDSEVQAETNGGIGSYTLNRNNLRVPLLIAKGHKDIPYGLLFLSALQCSFPRRDECWRLAWEHGHRLSPPAVGLVINQSTGEAVMELQKLELLQKMEEKGISVAEAAERITFDAALLKLYFAQDAYPVPTRIMDKLAEAISN
jgi:hypothetical protein